MDDIERKRGIGAGMILGVVAIVLVVAAVAFGLIDIDQTKKAKLPEIAVQGGQAPAFDVDTAKVKVGSDTTDVTVPTVAVSTEKVGVEVPTVDVEKAK
jgi:hypothetical protein